MRDVVKMYHDAKIGDDVSLSKYLGAQVTDLVGSIIDYDGTGTPIFKIFKVIFDDYSELFMEGEHDCPYISSDKYVPGLEQESMMAIVESEQ